MTTAPVTSAPVTSAPALAPAPSTRATAQALTPTSAPGSAPAPASALTSAAPTLSRGSRTREARPDLAAPAPSKPTRAVPEGTETRGFVLYVGLDEAKAAADGTSLSELVEAIKQLTAALAPSAETYAAVALAPVGSGGRDVDVVRLALGDPAAHAKLRKAEPATNLDRARDGIVIDLSRKRLLIDNHPITLTYKEFELLRFLVLREGQTVERLQLIQSIWSDAAEEEVPNERTIDVHVRRLRLKLGDYQDIVQTVRGVGYRFDRHADVTIQHSSTPSPDVF